MQAHLQCYKFVGYTGICDGETSNLVATSTNTFTETIDFPTEATSTLPFLFDEYFFDPNAYYKIGAIGGGTNTNTYTAGSITDEYINGACTGGQCGNVLDLSFTVTGFSPYSHILEIIEPTVATTTPTGTVDVEVTYLNTGNSDTLTLFIWDRVTSQQVPLSVSDFSIIVGKGTVSTTISLNEGSYKLQAGLFDSITGSSFGGLESVDFNVITDKVFEIFGANIYDSNGLLNLATSTCGITNLTGCFQNALVFAFVPDESSFDRFSDLREQLINKPPFGYFALLVGELSNISSSTPAFALAGEENIQDNIFTPLKTGLTWLLWFVFGVWLYNRVKDMTI